MKTLPFVYKRLFIIAVIVTTFLLIPLLAMQFAGDVQWSLFDFAIMGTLLFIILSICDFILRKVQSKGNRIFFLGIILFLFFLLWAELSVGIFGSPIAGN
jgi:hypothetical protein